MDWQIITRSRFQVWQSILRFGFRVLRFPLVRLPIPPVRQASMLMPKLEGYLIPKLPVSCAVPQRIVMAASPALSATLMESCSAELVAFSSFNGISAT